MAINNQDQVANRINAMVVGRGWEVEAVGDDGNVCVQIKGDRTHVIDMAKRINDAYGHYRVGDGVQEGTIFVNGEDCDIHDDVDVVAEMN